MAVCFKCMVYCTMYAAFAKRKVASTRPCSRERGVSLSVRVCYGVCLKPYGFTNRTRVGVHTPSKCVCRGVLRDISYIRFVGSEGH